jgi:hypothetical protein
MEYPVHCNCCGKDFEDHDVIRGSLDWFGEQDETFCPACHSDDLSFGRPKEDHDIARFEELDFDA